MPVVFYAAGNGVLLYRMNPRNKEITTVDEYIQTCSGEVQHILKQLRKIVREVAPQIQEKISYKMPTFSLNGMYVIYFAAWKKHISLYPYSSAMEKEFPEAARYNTSGKGTIQFPIDKPIPYDLVKKIVKFRLKEIQKV